MTSGAEASRDERFGRSVSQGRPIGRDSVPGGVPATSLASVAACDRCRPGLCPGVRHEEAQVAAVKPSPTAPIHPRARLSKALSERPGSARF